MVLRSIFPGSIKKKRRGISKARANVDKLSDRTRHLKNRDYFCRECVAMGEAHLIYVPSSLNIADFMTKILSRNNFVKLRDQIMGYKRIEFLNGKDGENDDC